MKLDKYLPKDYDYAEQLHHHYEVSRLLVDLEMRDGNVDKALRHIANQKEDLEELSRLQWLKRDKDEFKRFFDQMEFEHNQTINWEQVKRAYK